MSAGGESGAAGGAVSTAGGGAAGAGGLSGASATGGASGGGSAGANAGGGGAGGNGGGAGFVLTSPALENKAGCSVDDPSTCDAFPNENVSYADNANVSPELRWTGAPAGTQSFALVLFDVSFGQAHWALWNIPGSLSALPANVAKDTATPPVPAGSQQANANFATAGGDGYFGPHLPCNVFELQLYALSTSTFSPMDADSSVLVSIELQDLGSVLGVAKLTGRGGVSTCD